MKENDVSMNSHLPDFRSKEDGVLYIIGNGFDIYHGLKTKYKNFREWLLGKYPEFVDSMQKIYPRLRNQEYELWCDFEVALGHNRPCSELHDLFVGDDVNTISRNQRKTYAAEQIKKTLDMICPYLLEWSYSFKYDDIEKVLPLGKGSKYVTFNYTKTLEEVYNIKGDNTVLHIHGSIDTGNLETGYGYADSLYPVGNAIEVLSQENIKRELERFKKQTASIYERNHVFFDNLTNINTIVIIGHSLADVDIPYLYYLLEPIHYYQVINCQYWVHNEDAKAESQKRIRDLCNQWGLLEDKIPENRWLYYTMDKYR